MESKKKKKIILIVSLVSIFLIVAVLGTFFTIKAINNKDNDSSTPATNVNSSLGVDERLFEAHKAIMNEEVSADFNGNYKFKTVSSIIFNKDLNKEQIEKICALQGTNDPNGLQGKILETKKAEATQNNEVIVLKAKDGYGSYTRSYNSKDVIEYGRYFGNNDLSEISIYDYATKDYFSLYDMSLTSIKEADITSLNSSANTHKDKLYLYKKVYSKENPNLILFTITYVYELIPAEPPISDSELDFVI